jgi:uncharacterized protein (DUF2235 family)
MRTWLLAIPLAATLGCGGVKYHHFVPVNGCPPRTAPQKLVIFFDGTANTEASHTNVSKLHSMVTLQKRCDISTYYVQGVGTAGRFLGGMTGWGIGRRVRMAYQWLGENYDATRGDSVFLFGFSRGAYTARILAALTYAAGVPDLRRYDDPDLREALVDQVYDAYKGDMVMQLRRQHTRRAMLDVPAAPVDIVFMGLFDTVEALGVWRPIRSRAFHWQEEDVEGPNRKYGDQLCNVKKAAHAMSLDDNRAFIFTPLLLTRKHLTEHCIDGEKVDIDQVVNEVWFAGAHSDVGGRKNTELDDVPLNWMIGELRPYGLIRGDTIYSDMFGPAENPRTGGARVIYHAHSRNVHDYIHPGKTSYNGGKLKVHDGALRRLDRIPNAWWQSDWYETKPPFGNCFLSRDTIIDGRPEIVWTFQEGVSGCRVDRVYTKSPGAR